MQPLRDHLDGLWAPDVTLTQQEDGSYVASALTVSATGPDREQALDRFQSKWQDALLAGTVLPDM
jgi:hypothetical protein